MFVSEPLTYKYSLPLTYDQRPGMFNSLRAYSILRNQHSSMFDAYQSTITWLKDRPSHGQRSIIQLKIDHVIKSVTTMH
jgi:hypothetical protein